VTYNAGRVVGEPASKSAFTGSSIERLKAYSDAGADVLYAPGVSSPQEITKPAATRRAH